MDDAPNISTKYVINQNGIFGLSILIEQKHFVESEIFIFEFSFSKLHSLGTTLNATSGGVIEYV